MQERSLSAAEDTRGRPTACFQRISRRTVLKGVGAAVALPLLEVMQPLEAGAPAVKAAPKRLAFLYVPNGKHMPDWTPKSEGGLRAAVILEPLAAGQERPAGADRPDGRQGPGAR